MTSDNHDIFWKFELDELFELDQKERKEFDSFLEKKGYIKGSYNENWTELLKQYQNSKGLSYSPGDRIFSNILRDTRLENLVYKYSDFIILDPEYQNKLFNLVKNCDTNLNLQIFFLSKLKNIKHCKKIIKNLEERIKFNSNFQQLSTINVA